MKEKFSYFLGYVVLDVYGDSVKRFMNLCIRQGFLIWNIRPIEEGQYQLCMLIQDFWKIRPLRRKTSVKIKVLRRIGVPFIVHRYRNRIFFPVSFLFSFAFLIYSCSYIWKIEVNGNSYLSKEAVILYLDSIDQGFGTKKAEISGETIELALRKHFPQVIWASSYFEGTKLVVEIQENINPKEETKTAEDVCTDLVARKDAVIASIITRNGTPYVMEGDEVHEGEVLVCGRQEIFDDNGEVADYIYHSANADIYGYVTYHYYDEIPIKDLISLQDSEYTTCYLFQICDRTFSIGFPNPYEQFYSISELHQMTLSEQLYLPVFWGKQYHINRKDMIYKRSKKEITAIAQKNLANFIAKLEENGVSITDKNVIMKEIGDSYVISGTIKACEDITMRKATEILQVEQEGTQTDEHE